MLMVLELYSLLVWLCFRLLYAFSGFLSVNEGDTIFSDDWTRLCHSVVIQVANVAIGWTLVRFGRYNGIVRLLRNVDRRVTPFVTFGFCLRGVGMCHREITSFVVGDCFVVYWAALSRGDR